MSGQNGVHVQKNVEMDKRLEHGHVLILLLHMVVNNVKEMLKKLQHERTRNAQVIIPNF